MVESTKRTFRVRRRLPNEECLSFVKTLFIILKSLFNILFVQRVFETPVKLSQDSLHQEGESPNECLLYVRQSVHTSKRQSIFFKVNRMNVCLVYNQLPDRERERSLKGIVSPPSLSLFLILSLTMLFLPRCERNND